MNIYIYNIYIKIPCDRKQIYDLLRGNDLHAFCSVEINMIQTYIIHSKHYQVSSLFQHFVEIWLRIRPFEILLCLFHYSNMGFRRPLTLRQFCNFDSPCNLSQYFFLSGHQHALLFCLLRFLEEYDRYRELFCRQGWSI